MRSSDLPYAATTAARRREEDLQRILEAVAVRQRSSRRLRSCCTFTAPLFVFLLLWLAYARSNRGSHVKTEQASARDLPPNYYAWHDRERAMPQNNAKLPPPQGRHGRYIRFNNWAGNIGWGNAMQEMILHAHIAYRSGRTFAMYNYTWNKDTLEDYWTYDHGDKHSTVPARIPITALLAGPIAGTPFPASDWRPPAVTTEFFEEVCPHPTIITPSDAKGEFHSSSAASILDAVVSKLNSTEDNCVEFPDGSGQIIDYWLFGDGARMADAWPQLLESPILTEWQWSELVTSGLERNRELVHHSIVTNDRHRDELPGLLALHVRRGDFREHCEHIGKWRLPYNAWNVRSGIVDVFDPPPGGGNGEGTPELLEYYFRHCFPEINEIVARVKAVVTDAASQRRILNRVYIMTNASPEWLSELTTALREIKQWKSITTSRDLRLSWEQKFVAQAIDQVIASRAEVFVGNPVGLKREPSSYYAVP